MLESVCCHSILDFCVGPSITFGADQTSNLVRHVCQPNVGILQDVDVEWFLKQWDGQYNTEWQSRSEVIVRFTTPQALKEALTALGGGIRGVFRVDRG